MRFFIQTFGCQMNENDSLLMSGLLKSAGHICSDEAATADIILVNTCSVREAAENRALGYIGSLKKLKQEDSKRVIIVCGCMAQRSGVAELLKDHYHHVGIVIGTFAASRLPQYISEYIATGKRIFDVEERYDGEELLRMPGEEKVCGYHAQVNINFGCNNFCSYCIVPYVRGRERSRRPEEICNEVHQLVAAGVREVQLLGQNVNSYGKDFTPAVRFADLLEQVDAIEGLRRIRFMTSHPRDFDEDLIMRLAAMKRVMHQIHLPVQSGSDRLLREMNRGYTTEHYRRIVGLLRQAMPDVVLTTDLIVGFPGETEEDFCETLDFVREMEFDSAYTFIYSRRSGTKAAEMDCQIPEVTKKERLQRLMDVQNPISLEKNQCMVGKNFDVMIEGRSRNDAGTLSARTEGNKVVILPYAENLFPGDIVSCKITGAQTWNLMGEFV